MSNKYFFEHDDRLPSTSKSSYPRQNFAMGGRHKDKKYRNSGGKSRMIDPDGDIDMGVGPHASFDRRFAPYNHGQKNHRRRNKKGMKHDDRSHGSNDRNNHHAWYKISIVHGKKLGKEYILKAINNFVKVAFTPYNFQFNKNNAEFYVYGHTICTQIKEANRRVTTPYGFKMIIMSYNVSNPIPCIDSSVIEVIKTAMSACYDPERHSLNLMKFHEVDILKMNGLYIPLNKTIVFQPVMRIIKENIPEIEILILSQNKLYNLEAASVLVPVCKQLRSVNLQNNKLRSVSELNSLKGLDLEELILDGNPLCDDYKDKGSYISAVREKFPKLRRLDGHDLPAAIGFDLGSETVPVSNKSCFIIDGVEKDMVIHFLDAYYTVYDSGERTRLLDAYHEQAVFSLCLSKNTPIKSTPGSLGAYLMDNRNLLKIVDSRERFRLLKQGKLSVVNALQELPQTMHDPSSFSIDLFHVSGTLMSFSVIGVFKEVGADINNATLKTFSRTFVVAPHGSGFVIVNETLFIANASTEQQQKAFKVPAPTPSPSPAPPIEEKTANEKQLMVMTLSKETNMNIGFSSKCLEENDWDYPKALAVFMKFQSEGRLPPEAFIH